MRLERAFRILVSVTEEFTPVDGMVGTNKVWQIIEGSFDPQKFFEGGMNEADAPKFVTGNFEADNEYWLVIGSTDWEGIEQPYVYPMTADGYTLDSEYSARYFFAMGEGATAMFKLSKLHTHGTEYKSDADNHWNECSCGDKANVAPHADTNNDEKCDACGYAMPASGNTVSGTDDPTDDKDGLGAGAIVGIVVGVLAVLGGGGFALYWFVLKKKPIAPTDPTTPVEEAHESNVDEEAAVDADADETVEASIDTADETPETEGKKDDETQE